MGERENRKKTKMSIVAFGKIEFKNYQDMMNFKRHKNSFIGCNIRKNKEVDEATCCALKKLCGIEVGKYIEFFEISDNNHLLDHNATELLTNKVYVQCNGEWLERTPNLLSRLTLLQDCICQIFYAQGVKAVQLFISDQGYPLLSDCKILDIGVNAIAQAIYREYEQYEGAVPTLLIKIKA